MSFVVYNITVWLNKNYLQELSLLYFNNFKAVQLRFISFGALSIILDWCDAGSLIAETELMVPRFLEYFILVVRVYSLLCTLNLAF